MGPGLYNIESWLIVQLPKEKPLGRNPKCRYLHIYEAYGHLGKWSAMGNQSAGRGHQENVRFSLLPFPFSSCKSLHLNYQQSINVFAWCILQIKKPWWKNLKNNISKFWDLFWPSGVPGGPECTEPFLHRKGVESWCIWLTGWFSSLSSWAPGQVNGQESFHLQSKMGWKALLAYFVHINYTCLQFINSFSPLYPYVM